MHSPFKATYLEFELSSLHVVINMCSAGSSYSQRTFYHLLHHSVFRVDPAGGNAARVECKQGQFVRNIAEEMHYRVWSLARVVNSWSKPSPSQARSRRRAWRPARDRTERSSLRCRRPCVLRAAASTARDEVFLVFNLKKKQRFGLCQFA